MSVLRINSIFMAKQDFTKEQLGIVSDALETYGGEVKKLMKKADKLGLPEAETLKQTFLEVEALRDKVSTE